MRYLLFGASSTFGVGDPEFGGWSTRLQFYLDKQEGARLFHNLAISGNTTKDLLRRFSQEAKERIRDKPKKQWTTFFSLGTNDASRVDGVSKVSEEDYENNLHELLRQAKALVSRVVVLSGFPIIEEVCNPFKPGLYFLNKDIFYYDKILQRVCEKEGVEYFSVFNKFSNHTEKTSLYSSDGLHLSVKGHELYFSLIRDYLEKN